MTHIYLVRHGETDWNIERKLQGSTDIPLNDQGRSQAASLQQHFENVTFDAAYSSDLIRAKETAEIICKQKKLPVNIHKALRERSWGNHEGQTFDSLRLKYGALFQPLIEDYDYKADDVHPDLHQVESYASAVQRAIDYLMKIQQHYLGKSILVVSHGGILKGVLLSLNLPQFKNFYVNNTAYVHLEVKDRKLFLNNHHGIMFNK